MFHYRTINQGLLCLVNPTLRWYRTITTELPVSPEFWVFPRIWGKAYFSPEFLPNFLNSPWIHGISPSNVWKSCEFPKISQISPSNYWKSGTFKTPRPWIFFKKLYFYQNFTLILVQILLHWQLSLNIWMKCIDTGYFIPSIGI